ncbi:MAG: lysoplasmalogenase [Treponema sp.]|nr:lysoplasmalogenase [Treponema sp.]
MKSIITFVLMLLSMVVLDLTGEMPVQLCGLSLRVYAKTITSILFVLTGIFAMRERRGGVKGGPYARLVLTGLLFGLIGDVFMALNKDFGGFLYVSVGLVTFALGHVFYLIAFSRKSRFHWFNLIPLLIIIPAILIAVSLTGKFKFSPPALFYAVIAYGVILSCMVGRSLSFTDFREHPAFVRLTIIGTILFATSDLILLFIMFYTPVASLPSNTPVRVTLSVFNLLTYYVGQGLIALSLKEEP